MVRAGWRMRGHVCALWGRALVTLPHGALWAGWGGAGRSRLPTAGTQTPVMGSRGCFLPSPGSPAQAGVFVLQVTPVPFPTRVSESALWVCGFSAFAWAGSGPPGHWGEGLGTALPPPPCSWALFLALVSQSVSEGCSSAHSGMLAPPPCPSAVTGGRPQPRPGSFPGLRGAVEAPCRLCQQDEWPARSPAIPLELTWASQRSLSQLPFTGGLAARTVPNPGFTNWPVTSVPTPSPPQRAWSSMCPADLLSLCWEVGLGPGTCLSGFKSRLARYLMASLFGSFCLCDSPCKMGRRTHLSWVMMMKRNDTQ